LRIFKKGGTVKAYVIKYKKTGKWYLYIEEAGIVKYHYIHKEDYPFLNEENTQKLTDMFEIRR